MTRLWRAATLIVPATVLVVGPASAVFATEGDSGGRDGRPADSAPDRRGNAGVDTTVDVVVDQPEAPVVDPTLDRVPERDRDRDRDRPTDRVRDSVTDRPHRPECDPDRATDRVHDCEPTDEIRPALKRCIHYVQEHTDIVVRRNLRSWYRVCHRLAWNHNHPQ